MASEVIITLLLSCHNERSLNVWPLVPISKNKHQANIPVFFLVLILKRPYLVVQSSGCRFVLLWSWTWSQTV